MQAKDILADNYSNRNAIYAARDRCDETVEHMRGVRTQRFKYFRNFLPKRPHLQPNRYKDAKAIIKDLRARHVAGSLDPLQEELLFAPERAPEEFYDLKNDPFELKNLAADPEFEQALKRHRRMLDKWIIETKDKGAESEEMYDSDMAPYLQKNSNDPEQDRVLRENIALMKKWAAEGK